MAAQMDGYLRKSKFWKIGCLRLDLIDYLSEGDVGYLDYALQDLEELKELIEQEKKEKT